jgi:complex III assembly factor LYRM7
MMEQDDPALAPAISHAEEVAKILRENVVQGKRVDRDGEERYSECFFVHGYGSESRGLMRTGLRIHEHTERGDNDTVKMPNGQKVVIDGKTCSDR